MTGESYLQVKMWRPYTPGIVDEIEKIGGNGTHFFCRFITAWNEGNRHENQVDLCS